jgi:hypothetical protein
MFMILRQFVSNSPFLLVNAPLIAGGVLIPAGYAGSLRVQELAVPGDALFGWCMGQLPLCAVMATVLITASAWLMNAIFNRYEFYSAAVFAPSLLCTTGLVAGSLPALNLPALLAFLLVLISLHRLLGVHRQPVVLRTCFESAFFAGLAALTYPPALGTLAGLVMALALARRFNWREFAMLVLGYSVPFVYWLVYKFWFRQTDRMYLFVKSHDRKALAAQLFSADSIWFMASLLAVLLMALPRYYFPGERLSNRSHNTRRVFMALALTYALAVPASVVLQGAWSVSPAVLVFAVVAAAWFSNYRFSLLAPFVFYAWLGIMAWLTWRQWQGGG